MVIIVVIVIMAIKPTYIHIAIVIIGRVIVVFWIFTIIPLIIHMNIVYIVQQVQHIVYCTQSIEFTVCCCLLQMNAPSLCLLSCSRSPSLPVIFIVLVFLCFVI